MAAEEGGAVSQAIAASSFVQSIQRDLNCLSDPDRITKRRALERLEKRLSEESLSGEMLQIAWDESILKLLVRALHDPVEKCREAAVGVVFKMVKVLPDVEQTAYLVIPATAERIGQLPLVEQSEEIRLSLVNLLIELVSRCSEESLRYESSEPLARVTCLVLLDSFHETKKAACTLLSRLSSRASSVISDNSEAFLKALLPNLSHAHSRVRLAVLSALNNVILCGIPAGMIAEYVASGIKATAFDHSEAVREVYFKYIARWLGYESNDEVPLDATKNETAYMPYLLPLLLLGVADDSVEISAATLTLVDGVGEIYKHWNASDFSTESSCWKYEADVLPAPFKSEPSYGSRLMVQRYLQQMLQGCSKDLHDWTTITRLGAARLLQTALVFAEALASKYLDALIATICSAVGDDDFRVAQHIVKSAHILGFNTKPDLWLDLIMDCVTSLRCTAAQRANALVVLAGLLYGTPRDAIQESFVIQFFQGLSHADLFLDESVPVRRQLLAVLTNLIAKAGPLCRVSSKEIFVLLLQLEALGGDGIQEDASTLVEVLAQVTGYNSSTELYAYHMRELVTQATAGYDEWLGSSPRKLFFQVVMRNAGALAGPYLKDVICVFTNCSRPEKDPALRISLLQLLDHMFETPGLESSWRPLAKRVILEVLIPCGVWQAGKVGAAVRHAAMVALGTFLRRGLTSQADLNELLETEKVLPVVTSCLEEDFYVDTRRATCHVMENIVHVAGGALKDDYRAKIGTALQKRLDDSNDDVRLGILRAIFVFFNALPPSYADTEVKSCLSSLVLHMDDQNLQIKESVCKVVEVCALKRPALVVEIVNDVRSKHESSQYCDHLLTVAASIRIT